MKTITELKISEIHACPWNGTDDRNKPDPVLVQDIRTHGVLEPVLVRKTNGKIQLIAGTRRTAAAKEAGLKTIPGIVMDVDDVTAQAITFSENHARKDQSLMATAKLVKTMLGKNKPEAVAIAMGRTESEIQRLARLDTLLPEFANSNLSLDFLSYVATMTAEMQDHIWNWLQDFETNQTPDVRALKAYMKKTSRDLGKATWAMDEVLEGIGPVTETCEKCPLRLKPETDLFKSKTDTCTAGWCFDRKLQGKRMKTARETAAKATETLSRKVSVVGYLMEPVVKPDTEGAVPVVVQDKPTTVQWVKPTGQQRREIPVKVDPKVRESQRRNRDILLVFKERIAKVQSPPSHLTDTQVLNWLADCLRSDNETRGQAIWGSICRRIRCELMTQTLRDFTDDKVEYAKKTAKLMDWDWKEITQSKPTKSEPAD